MMQMFDPIRDSNIIPCLCNADYSVRRRRRRRRNVYQRKHPTCHNATLVRIASSIRESHVHSNCDRVREFAHVRRIRDDFCDIRLMFSILKETDTLPFINLRQTQASTTDVSVVREMARRFIIITSEITRDLIISSMFHRTFVRKTRVTISH